MFFSSRGDQIRSVTVPTGVAVVERVALPRQLEREGLAGDLDADELAADPSARISSSAALPM